MTGRQQRVGRASQRRSRAGLGVVAWSRRRPTDVVRRDRRAGSVCHAARRKRASLAVVRIAAAARAGATDTVDAQARSAAIGELIGARATVRNRRDLVLPDVARRIEEKEDLGLVRAIDERRLLDRWRADRRRDFGPRVAVPFPGVRERGTRKVRLHPVSPEQNDAAPTRVEHHVLMHARAQIVRCRGLGPARRGPVPRVQRELTFAGRREDSARPRRVVGERRRRDRRFDRCRRYPPDGAVPDPQAVAVDEESALRLRVVAAGTLVDAVESRSRTRRRHVGPVARDRIELPHVREERGAGTGGEATEEQNRVAGVVVEKEASAARRGSNGGRPLGPGGGGWVPLPGVVCIARVESETAERDERALNRIVRDSGSDPTARSGGGSWRSAHPGGGSGDQRRRQRNDAVRCRFVPATAGDQRRDQEGAQMSMS